MKHFYNPVTGELIRTETPSEWMGITEVTPPVFDPATAGCFWRGAAWEIVVAAPAPGISPLEQIRILEAQYADAQAKLTRQSLLALALDKACADPAAAGMARAQVHDILMAGNNGYAALFNLEQQVAALRAKL